MRSKLKNNQIKKLSELVKNTKEEILYDEKQEYLDRVVFDNEFFYLKKGSLGMEIKTYREKFTPQVSIRSSMADYSEEIGLINLPLYAIDRIN